MFCMCHGGGGIIRDRDGWVYIERERERWQECALIQIEFFKVACSVGSSAPCQDHRKTAQK